MLPESGAAGHTVGAVFEAARRRALLRQVLQGVAAALLALAVLALIAQPSRRALLIFAVSASALIAASLRLRRRSRTPRALAASLESRRPQLHNVVVTAEELLRHPERAPDGVRERVFADAAASLRSIRVGVLWPLGRLVAGVATAAGMAATAFALSQRGGTGSGVATQAPGAAHADVAIEVVLTPPPYTRRPIVSLQNPERVEAVEGTVARVTVANARDVRIRLGARPLAVTSVDERSVVETRLTDSGYLAVETSGSDATTRLIVVTVVPDRTPVARIERPARDLLLPDARSSVEVTGSVADDIAVRALSLRYTRVSGSGEQFEFVEGELPLQIASDSDAAAGGPVGRFRAAAPRPRAGRLARLSPHRARRAPRRCRHGRRRTRSSLRSPGRATVPLEGFEMPPEQERYALSQQMIVVKMSGLRERRTC